MVSNDDVNFPIEKVNLNPIMSESKVTTTGTYESIRFTVPTGKRWQVQLARVSCGASADYLRIYLQGLNPAVDILILEDKAKPSALFEPHSRLSLPSGWSFNYSVFQSSGSNQNMTAKLVYEEETEY